MVVVVVVVVVVAVVVVAVVVVFVFVFVFVREEGTCCSATFSRKARCGALSFGSWRALRGFDEWTSQGRGQMLRRRTPQSFDGGRGGLW